MPVPATPKTEASLLEIFSSIQGEGLLVGCRQIFLRWPNCNLDCQYCDTPFAPSATCQIEDPPGSGQNRTLTNPVALDQVLALIDSWCEQAPAAHHSISLTGGEPLLHAAALRDWLPQLRKRLPIYLETNGTLPEPLANLLPLIDWVSMDIKLPSVTGQATDWELQRKFLRLAVKTRCYVKLVVGQQTPEEEVVQAAALIERISPVTALVLQPVTVAGKAAISSARLLSLQQAAAAQHPETRVIPQMHVFLGLL